MSESIEFSLPLGLEENGKLLRRGKMHLATTKDELELQDDDMSSFNVRYRDISLLSRVIDSLDGVSPVTTDMIMNLYEADFIYLQLLYKQLNGDVDTKIRVKCPKCGSYTNVEVKDLYKDTGLYED